MATADSVKAKLQGLIAKANEATGNTDADLTTAVDALVAGFGQGGGSATSEITVVTAISNAVEFNSYWGAIGETGTCLYVRDGWKYGFDNGDGVYWVLFIDGNIKFAIRRYSGGVSFPNLAGGPGVVTVVPAGTVFRRMEIAV